MTRTVRSKPCLTDKEVIIIFVDYLARNGNPGLVVDACPDKENRQSSDIDAIAGPFAIEHSSVDTVAKQRRDSAWFLEVVGGLEDELGHKLSYRLNLTLPYEGVQCGQDWSKIRGAFREWILHESPKLATGSHNISNALGIPFEFHVTKKKSDRPCLLFYRFAPDIKKLPSRLREQLDRKAVKLSPYKNEGKTTILLVESNDIALMDDSKMWDSLRQAYSAGLPDGVDQIWFADTSICEEVIFTDMTKVVAR